MRRFPPSSKHHWWFSSLYPLPIGYLVPVRVDSSRIRWETHWIVGFWWKEWWSFSWPLGDRRVRLLWMRLHFSHPHRLSLESICFRIYRLRWSSSTPCTSYFRRWIRNRQSSQDNLNRRPPLCKRECRVFYQWEIRPLIIVIPLLLIIIW